MTDLTELNTQTQLAKDVAAVERYRDANYNGINKYGIRNYNGGPGTEEVWRKSHEAFIAGMTEKNSSNRLLVYEILNDNVNKVYLISDRRDWAKHEKDKASNDTALSMVITLASRYVPVERLKDAISEQSSLLKIVPSFEH